MGKGGFGQVYKVKINEEELAEKIIEFDLSNMKTEDIKKNLEVLFNEINVMQKITVDSLKYNFNFVKLKGLAFDYLKPTSKSDDIL